MGEPTCHHHAFLDALSTATRIIGEIENVLAIDFVGTEHVGLDLAREPLTGFLDGGYEVERKVKGWQPFWIEAAAVDRRTFAGGGMKRPARMVRAIGGPDKSQAKPPRARESR